MKRTALYSIQAQRHPKFSPFGGWELPIYYTSILKEHEAVREKVGLFDVSHLGHLEVSGSRAVGELNKLVTQDLAKLPVGRAIYTPMLNSEGAILDEMILYRLGEETIRLVANAANGDKILAWIKSHFSDGAVIEDLREKVGTLALQGPRALETLNRVSEAPFDQLPRYAVWKKKVAGQLCWVARTGYTGEDGAELFVPVAQAKAVWQGLLEAGRPFDIQPVGLGARDTLRLEAGLPLGGSDLDERTTPLEANLDWTVDWGKGPFIGREALERQKKEGIQRKLTGFRLKTSGIPRHGCRIFYQGKPVGVVTSGTFLPATGGIGMGYLPLSAVKPGTPIGIEIHGREVEAEVVHLPFYRRKPRVLRGTFLDLR